MKIKLRLPKLVVHAHEACRIPRGYGIAYRDIMRQRLVCAPVPLNLIYQAFEFVWSYLVMGFDPTGRARTLLSRPYRAGYMDGFQQGHEHGIHEGKRQAVAYLRGDPAYNSPDGKKTTRR